jgi:hypothetical protein
MKLEPNWREWGLTRENLYTSEALPFWLQYDPDLFIRVIIHEIREEMSIVFECARMVSESSEAAAVKLSDSLTVREVCDVMFQHKDILMEITDTAWRYAIATKSARDQTIE